MSLLASLCLVAPMDLPQEPAVPAAATATAPAFTVDLRHRGQRKWKLHLPAEEWRPVGTAFRLQATHGFDFKTSLEGTRLLVDTDGDGDTDVSLEGKTAFVTLRGKAPSGSPLGYSIRLANDGGWKYAPGGYLIGNVKGTKIRLIDQNNNGVFGEVGKDALIVGNGKVATFQSAVIHVGGALYSVTMAEDGTQLACTPFQGPTGKLQLACTTKGKVMAAVVRSADRQFSFDMALAQDGMAVPVGAYQLVTGQLGLGASRVTMKTGRSQPIAVGPQQTKEVCWGGPIQAEFAYQRGGGKVKLSPDQVWLYGAAGELYTDWVPLGASPKFTITEDPTGKEVAQAHFPGTC